MLLLLFFVVGVGVGVSVTVGVGVSVNVGVSVGKFKVCCCARQAAAKFCQLAEIICTAASQSIARRENAANLVRNH